MSVHASGRHDRYTARAAAIALSALIVAGGGTAHAAEPGDTPVPHSASLANGSGAKAADEKSPAAKSAAKELRQGHSGAEVKAVQKRLIELGYWIDSADGEFGGLTTQAVYAVQKAAGISRDGVVGPATRKALDDGVRPKASSTSGRAVELDLKRQLLLVVADGKVKQILNTSTGTGKSYTSEGVKKTATTPKGTYRVFRQVDAWDPGPLGKLYRPKYFNGGIAVHGYNSVPPVPASHGCARVSVAAMDWLWQDGRLANGTPVIVR